MTLETYSASLTPTLPLLPFLVSGVGLVMFAGTLFFFKGKQVILGIILSLAILVGGVSFTVIEDRNSSSQKIQNLQSWIHAKYGVSVNTENAKKLAIGKEVAIEHDKKEITVELKKYKGKGELLTLNNLPLPQK